MSKHKKLALLVLCASTISQAAVAAEGRAVSYNFLSGGLAVDKNGLASDYQKLVEERELKGMDLKANDIYRLKSSRVGGYLTGSYGFDNNVFLEAQLRYLSGRQNGFFAGVGYHFPINEQSDIYILGGVSKPDLPSSSHLTQKGREFFQGGSFEDPAALAPKSSAQVVKSPFCAKNVIMRASQGVNLSSLDCPDADNLNIEVAGKTLSPEEKKALVAVAAVADAEQSALKDQLDKATVQFKSKLAPSIEVGYRANLTDEMGVRLAYRLTHDNIEIQHVAANGTLYATAAGKGLSNELSVGAHYHFTPQLAAEAGYTFTKLTKVGDLSPKGSHRGTVGLRYAF